MYADAAGGAWTTVENKKAIQKAKTAPRPKVNIPTPPDWTVHTVFYNLTFNCNTTDFVIEEH